MYTLRHPVMTLSLGLGLVCCFASPSAASPQTDCFLFCDLIAGFDPSSYSDPPRPGMACPEKSAPLQGRFRWASLAGLGPQRSFPTAELREGYLPPEPGTLADQKPTPGIRRRLLPARLPSRPNPFGVMLPSQLVRTPEGIEVAKTLGVVYFRPASVFLDQWNGTCLECELALNAGLRLVLTVRNSGPLPTAPPRDLVAYQRTLSQVLDTYRPVVLAVENEENSALFYTGTPEEYGAQLRAACQVAHQRGIPCTNGGLVSTLVALLV